AAPEQPLVIRDPSLKELRDYNWRRFTTGQTVGRYIAYLVTILALIWTVRGLDIYWPWVWDSPTQIGDLLGRMFPPDFVRSNEIVRVLLETINIATLATLLSLVFAIPTAYIA